MDMSKFRPYNAADYLDSEEIIQEYLNLAAQDPNPDRFLQALANVAKARGINKLAEDCAMNSESLSETLKPGSKPGFDTIMKILNALNIKIEFSSTQVAS